MPTLKYDNSKDRKEKKKSDKIVKKFFCDLKTEPSIVSILYGDFSQDTRRNIRLRNEIISFASQDWVKKSVKFFVLGSYAHNLLKENGIQQIHLVDKKSSVAPGKSHWYNKAFLIDQAMSYSKEILYIDQDVKLLRPIDNDLWEALRMKKGKFEGEFQMVPVYNRHSKIFFWRDEHKEDLHYGLNACTVYCRNRYWTQQWLKTYADKRYGQRFLDYCGDEEVMTYFLEKIHKFRSSVKYLVQNFGLDIVNCGRGTWYKQRDWSHLYFYHHARRRVTSHLWNNAMLEIRQNT